MTNQNPEVPIESLLRDHYFSQSLPEEKVAAIVEARSLTRDVQRWQRIAIATSVGLAAMTVVAVSLFLQRETKQGMIADQPRDKRNRDASAAVVNRFEDDDDGSAQRVVDSMTDAEPQYVLVAIRSHGDGCPFCRATGDTFRQLRTSIDSDVVQMEEVHLGDPSLSSMNSVVLDKYNLRSLIKGRSETAFVALATTDGKVIESFKPSDGEKAIAARVRELTAASDNGV